MNEPTNKIWDKLLGANTAGILSLGAVAGGLIYSGIMLGSFVNRLEHVEERSNIAARCASAEQCEALRAVIGDLQSRTSKLEWKTGLVP